MYISSYFLFLIRILILKIVNKNSPYKEFNKALKMLFQLFVIGGLSLTVLEMLVSSHSFQWVYLLRAFFLYGTSFTIIWLGNGFLADWLNINYPWTKSTSKRLIISLIATVIYTFIAWSFIVFLWMSTHTGIPSLYSWWQNLALHSFLFTLFITLLVSGFAHGSQFLNNWKHAAIESEKLKKEQISAMYEMLKAQINPHFLFNSLNVLSTLVHKDADLAEQFINQLSKVYRYVLQTRDKEIVPLAEELEELESYIFLMKIRFGESFHFVKILTPSATKIVPLTLQMLIENALKHNEVSKAHPLSIELTEEGDYIQISNNLQRKKNVLGSTGVGLENIRMQYQILTDKAIEIIETNEDFIVKIPKIYA